MVDNFGEITTDCLLRIDWELEPNKTYKIIITWNAFWAADMIQML